MSGVNDMHNCNYTDNLKYWSWIKKDCSPYRETTFRDFFNDFDIYPGGLTEL